MQRFKGIAFVLLTLVLGVGAKPGSGQNLLRNPSFETVPNNDKGQDVIPSEWVQVKDTASTYSNDGSFGLKPEDFGNFTGVTAQDGIRWVAAFSGVPEEFGQILTTPLTPGRIYVLTAFLHSAKRADLTHPGTYRLTLRTTSKTDPLILGEFDPPIDNQDEWEQRTLTFIAPAGADTHPLLVFTPVSATGSTYPGIDNLSLEEEGVAGLKLNPATVPGCKPSKGRIILSAPAPANGAIVNLSSDTPAIASVPASITIPAGEKLAIFTVETKPVTDIKTVTITASYNGVNKTARLKVRPISVQSVGLSPNPVQGGNNVLATIKLECPAEPGDIRVEITSTNPELANPTVGSIIIKKGFQTGDFVTITTNRPVTRATATIKAKANGRTKGKKLRVNP